MEKMMFKIEVVGGEQTFSGGDCRPSPGRGVNLFIE